ncbi:MAG: type II toxin-antitoxin system Phd/YefM family antitoxin [bacterium]|nr:type II toxin-antitoxin system Phd/YefM family antitoxin [bacterium]
MMTLHPNILERDGQKAFVVLPYEEFVKVQEVLEDYEDLVTLRHAKDREGHAPTVSLHDAKQLLGIS